MRRLLRILVLALSVSLAALAVWVAQNPVAVRTQAGGPHTLDVDLSLDFPEQEREEFLFLGGLKSDGMSIGLIGHAPQIGSGGLGARGQPRERGARGDTDP